MATNGTARGAEFRERNFSARDGLELYFRDYGDSLSPGVAVLCLGGLTRNSKDFHPLARRLAERRRVLCPDYRGRGRSPYDPDWRNYAPPRILNDVLQLLAATNLHRVVVCGVSFGGYLAMAMGVAAPLALAGVILDDVGPEVDPEVGRQILDYVSVDRPQPDWDTAVAALRARFPNLSRRDEAAWRRFAEGSYREAEDGRLHFDWDPEIARSLRRMGTGPADYWPLYRSLRRVPVLAIRGGLSEMLSPETLARMAAEKPDLVQLTLPDVGHAPMLDEPETEQAIDDFLARIDDRANG
ncbi:MAG: alpha/beta fold hydrolase [Alphaproteobacteria bacterium]